MRLGAGCVPCHPDEERPVVAIVRRPPVLAVGHQRIEVFLKCLQIELLEFFRVVERGPPWDRTGQNFGEESLSLTGLATSPRFDLPSKVAAPCMTGHLPALSTFASIFLSNRVCVIILKLFCME